MALKTEIPNDIEHRTSEEIDGEIYVRLGKKSVGLRALALLAMFAITAGGLALGAYSQMSGITSGGQYAKGTTQCPGMTPAQKAAAAAAKH